jgi:predicted ATPase/class 3 adenylate cyclase/GAF domain-containing protein
MNRSLDYRTDFYSLGVTFYELLTGQLPFVTEDVLELVHCHIAKPPIPPHQLVGAHRRAPISKAISNIVMKLMAKTAEERYQSAWGLKTDLEECLKQLRCSGQISDFPLGTQEVYDRFQISQKLYGREREVEALLQAFERVTTGQSEFLLVAGYSGIGKSSLVQEIYKPITAKRGYFISGKFDQYQRNIPYRAIIQALKELLKQLLTETDAQLAEWKAKILTAVGTNGRVIIDIIPEVELIIGEQPPLLDLAAAEAQKRFNFVFQDFIKVFTEPTHPLTIFLDELQWADGASLKLIELLLTSSDVGLLLIGTYRDNEVNAAHPLRLTLENLQKEGVKIQEILLNPLELETVNCWLADTLKASCDMTQDLAELVQPKTGGNPFFITEFLQALYTENLLNCDYNQKRWTWDANQIQKRNFTDNVVELMVAKIQKVPPGTQEVLKLAACIGNQFQLETLAVIWETSARETALNLQEAVAEGLIQPLGNEYKSVLLEPLENEKNQVGQLKVEYQFVHDRIQQAAYSLITDEFKQRVHRLVRTKLMLAGKQIENLLALPEMTAPDKKAAMQILNIMISAAYLGAPNLMPLLTFKGVSLSVKYGNTFSSPVMYAFYGLTLCGILGDIESGYRFGNLALRVLERLKTRNVEARTVMLVNYFIRHWREHPQQTLQPLLDGYSTGLETLELEYAGYCAIVYCGYSYYIGQDLVLLEQEIAKYSEAFQKFQQETIVHFFNQIGETALALMSGSENQCCLIGEVSDESRTLQLYVEQNNTKFIFGSYIYKLMLCYWFEQEQESLENAALAERYIEGGVGSIAVPVFHFYDSLARLIVYLSLPKSQQRSLYRKVQSNQKKMKNWAHHAPMNYLHKFYLVEAERYRILGKHQKAMDYYDRAIALAKENQYIQEEALAYELAAKFYLSQGKELIARTYLQEAHYRYLRWGAIAKVKDLETRYPQLLQKSESSLRGNVNSKTSVTSTSGNQSSETLDLATVIKASQAISGEIVLEQLLMQLMKILLENAGAQTGHLILEQEGKFAIEASGTVETDSITVLQSLPLETKVPVSIINYVARSRESVICNNASDEGKFNTDPYIQQHHPKSILCTPLVNQGKLISIVYLENNLTVGAFTPQRIEVVNVLSSQAAISIENAKLYTEVRQNESRLLQLNQAFERFVPSEFLQFLNKQSIVDVQLGDQVEQEMSVLFSDIRDFTTLSEQMNPEDNFRFINSYLSRISPVIREHQGFIDKYIGDAIMALFRGGADNAVKAGIAMLNKLVEYNQHRTNSGYKPIQIGIGINTGLLMLGTVGEPNRMDGTVISDAVNLASRTEGLTKNYGVSLLITHETFKRLRNPRDYAIRRIDEVKVKGKSEYVTIYEVFDADPPELKAAKLAMLKNPDG